MKTMILHDCDCETAPREFATRWCGFSSDSPTLTRSIKPGNRADNRLFGQADLLLVFGSVDYAMPTNPRPPIRIIELPSLNDPQWTPKSFAVAAQYVTSGSKVDLDISFRNGRLTARNLIPF